MRRTAVDRAEIFDGWVDGALEVALFAAMEPAPDPAWPREGDPVDAMADLVWQVATDFPEATRLLRATLPVAGAPAVIRAAGLVLDLATPGPVSSYA